MEGLTKLHTMIAILHSLVEAEARKTLLSLVAYIAFFSKAVLAAGKGRSRRNSVEFRRGLSSPQ